MWDEEGSVHDNNDSDGNNSNSLEIIGYKENLNFRE
jgi:hypothetical protein